MVSECPTEKHPQISFGSQIWLITDLSSELKDKNKIFILAFL